MNSAGSMPEEEGGIERLKSNIGEHILTYTTILKNILLALLLSLALTLLLGLLYVFYPLIWMLLSIIWKEIVSSGPETGGIGSVAWGVSGSLKTFGIVVAILFLIIFTLLQRKTVKHQ